MADRFARHVSVKVMAHAASLDLATYENPLFHDVLDRGSLIEYVRAGITISRAGRASMH